MLFSMEIIINLKNIFQIYSQFYSHELKFRRILYTLFSNFNLY